MKLPLRLNTFALIENIQKSTVIRKVGVVLGVKLAGREMIKANRATLLMDISIEPAPFILVEQGMVGFD